MKLRVFSNAQGVDRLGPCNIAKVEPVGEGQMLSVEEANDRKMRPCPPLVQFGGQQYVRSQTCQE